jgi:hypothetical protein
MNLPRIFVFVSSRNSRRVYGTRFAAIGSVENAKPLIWNKFMPSEAHPDFVRLTSAPNSFEAGIWQQALQDAGIRCEVLGDYLEAGIGNLPGMSVELWVEAANLTRAQEILREHQNNSDTHDDSSEPS